MKLNEAIEYLKKGYVVSRRCWKEQDVFLYMVYNCIENTENLPDNLIRLYFRDIKPSFGISYRLHINMKTEDNSIIVGWTPTQTDILADDWELYTIIRAFVEGNKNHDKIKYIIISGFYKGFYFANKITPKEKVKYVPDNIKNIPRCSHLNRLFIDKNNNQPCDIEKSTNVYLFDWYEKRLINISGITVNQLRKSKFKIV